MSFLTISNYSNIHLSTERKLQYFTIQLIFISYNLFHVQDKKMLKHINLSRAKKARNRIKCEYLIFHRANVLVNYC